MRCSATRCRWRACSLAFSCAATAPGRRRPATRWPSSVAPICRPRWPPAAQLYEVVDPRPGLEMLARGRVDAVFFERGTMTHHLAAQPRLAGSVRWLAPALEVVPTYMAISRGHPQADAWLALLNREIRSAVRN